MTSAAEAKLRLSGQKGQEELADKVQRVVVLATPVVRLAARGAKFTRLPWAMVASSSVSIGIAVRAGVREIQVLSSLVAYRIEEATEAPADPGSSRRSPSTSISTRSGGPTFRTTGFGSFDSPENGCCWERSAGPPRSGPAKHSRRHDQARRQRSRDTLGRAPTPGRAPPHLSGSDLPLTRWQALGLSARPAFRNDPKKSAISLARDR